MQARGAPFRERRFTTSDGLSLYFRDYGDAALPATPVLCLCGLTRNSKDYHDLASRHAPHRRVLCPDYRGRGRSAYDDTWRNYRPETYLRDILELLAATDAGCVAVVGTSLGGLLAMGLAAVQPTALAGVVLNDIGPEVGGPALDRIVEYISASEPKPDWDAAVAELKMVFHDTSIRGEERWHAFARQIYRECDDGLLRYDYDPAIGRALAEAGDDAVPDLWPYFRALARIPTLAVRGAVSDVLSSGTFERMAETNPDMLRITVAGVGHPPHLDEPECRQAVDDFLASL